mgnify:CR=1 FL=1
MSSVLDVVRFENAGLVLIKAIGCYRSEDMGHGIYRAAVSGVVNVENGHQNIVDRFDDAPPLAHDFVVVVHELVFHVLAGPGNELDAFSVALLHESTPSGVRY